MKLGVKNNLLLKSAHNKPKGVGTSFTQTLTDSRTSALSFHGFELVQNFRLFSYFGIMNGSRDEDETTFKCFFIDSRGRFTSHRQFAESDECPNVLLCVTSRHKVAIRCPKESPKASGLGHLCVHVTFFAKSTSLIQR